MFLGSFTETISLIALFVEPTSYSHFRKRCFHLDDSPAVAKRDVGRFTRFRQPIPVVSVRTQAFDRSVVFLSRLFDIS